MLASLFLIEGILDIVLFFPRCDQSAIGLGAGRRGHDAVAGPADLSAMAVEFGLGDTHTGGGSMTISGVTRVMFSMALRRAATVLAQFQVGSQVCSLIESC